MCANTSRPPASREKAPSPYSPSLRSPAPRSSTEEEHASCGPASPQPHQALARKEQGSRPRSSSDYQPDGPSSRAACLRAWTQTLLELGLEGAPNLTVARTMKRHAHAHAASSRHKPYQSLGWDEGFLDNAVTFADFAGLASPGAALLLLGHRRGMLEQVAGERRPPRNGWQVQGCGR